MSRGRARLYYPDTRFVKMRIRNDSADEPENPDPSVLPPQARTLWNNVADEAEEIYGEHADPHGLPEKSAWHAVRMHYELQGNKWVRRRNPESELPEVLSSPGDVAFLGKLIEHAWITPDGHLHKRTFGKKPPDLWWSASQRTLFSFPTAKVPNHCLVIPNDMQDTAQMFKRWAQRDAHCRKEIDVPMVRMNPIGRADTISYRSDKWHDENPDPTLADSGEYIHTHGEGVWVWEDATNPNALMIRGGSLDVEERGIIH